MTVQGWSDNMCIEDLLVGAIYAMVDCEKDRVLAGSVEGPGGETGPLRVHFPAVNPANVLQVGCTGMAMATISAGSVLLELFERALIALSIGVGCGQPLSVLHVGCFSEAALGFHTWTFCVHMPCF